MPATDDSGEDSDAEGSLVLAATAPDYVLSPGVRAAAMAVSAEIDVQDNRRPEPSQRASRASHPQLATKAAARPPRPRVLSSGMSSPVVPALSPIRPQVVVATAAPRRRLFSSAVHEQKTEPTTEADTEKEVKIQVQTHAKEGALVTMSNVRYADNVRWLSSTGGLGGVQVGQRQAWSA